MENKRHEVDESVKSTSVSLASSAAATMIGFSVALITLMIIREDFLVAFPNGTFLFLFYILAIIFFIFSIEFLNLSSWDKKNRDIWATIGSVVYGLGYGWVIVGLSLTFRIMINSIFLAYLTLSLYLLGFIIYYFLRWKLTDEEVYIKTRIIARGTMIIQIFIGYVTIYILH